MQKIVYSIFLLSIVLLSCSSYQKSSFSADRLQALNDTLTVQQKSGADWTQSPEKIVKHFFPADGSNGGSSEYSITKKGSDNAFTVTVTDEGQADDELRGERHTLSFEKHEGLWKITALEYEVKRSN